MKRNMKVSVKCSNDRCYCCIPTISATVEYTQNGPEANGVVHSNYHQKKDRATTNCLKLLRRLMSLLLFMICISMITMISTFALRFSGGIHRFPVEFPEPTLIAEHREKILILSTRIGNPLRFEGSDQQKAELYRDLSGNKRLYAAHWDNVEYLERNKAMVAGPEQWTKPFFIRSIMRNESYGHFDWILWMDADTAILNCSVSVLDLIEHRAVTASNDSNVSLVFNGDKNAIVNNGVFAIRNNEWGLDFVEKWVFLKESGKSPWAEQFMGWRDQNIFIALIFGWDPHREATEKKLKAAVGKGRKFKMVDSQSIPKALKGLPSEFRHRVAMMPDKLWNSYDDRAEDTFILHCPGTDKQSPCKKVLVTKHIRSRSNCAALNSEIAHK